MNEFPILCAGISFAGSLLLKKKVLGWPVKAQTRNTENFYVCCDWLVFD